MVLSALVLCLSVAVPAAAEDAENKNLVVDDADLLTDREENHLMRNSKKSVYARRWISL